MIYGKYAYNEFGKTKGVIDKRLRKSDKSENSGKTTCYEGSYVIATASIANHPVPIRKCVHHIKEEF